MKTNLPVSARTAFRMSVLNAYSWPNKGKQLSLSVKMLTESRCRILQQAAKQMLLGISYHSAEIMSAADRSSSRIMAYQHIQNFSESVFLD